MSNQEGPWGGNVKESPWENAEKSPRKPKIIDFEPIKKNNGIDFKVSWLIGALLLVWLASGFYQIQPNEEGVVLRFGKYIDTTGAGLHYHLPFPIEAVKKVNITQERSITIGDSNAYNTSNIAALSNSRNTANNTASALSSFTESHMLTGDENIVDVNPYVELPAATNLRVVNYDNSTGSDLVTVAWDAPDYDEDLMFQRYNVFITQMGMRAAENNAEDGQDTQYTLTFRFDEEDIFIQTVYHYGKVNSDTIHVNVHELTTSIGSVTQDVADGISINRNEIIVNGATASEITVFNAAGTKEATYRNTDRADISSLPGGVHIAFITINGKNTALKFSK